MELLVSQESVQVRASTPVTPVRLPRSASPERNVTDAPAGSMTVWGSSCNRSDDATQRLDSDRNPNRTRITPLFRWPPLTFAEPKQRSETGGVRCSNRCRTLKLNADHTHIGASEWSCGELWIEESFHRLIRLQCWSPLDMLIARRTASVIRFHCSNLMIKIVRHQSSRNIRYNIRVSTSCVVYKKPFKNLN